MKKIPSHLKIFCASEPAVFTAPPGVPTARRAGPAVIVGPVSVAARRGGPAPPAVSPVLPPPWPVALLACCSVGLLVCGLLCVAAGCRLRPCCCDLLALALWAVAFACWLVACGGLYSWPVGWRLWPCSVPVLLEAVSLRPVVGLWGRISAPRRLYRARKPPPGAAGRLPGSLLSSSPRRGAGSRRRSRHGPPVSPSAGPPVGGPLVLLSVLASCLPVCCSCPPPRATPRKTPEKTRRIFPALLQGSSRACRVSATSLHTGGRKNASSVAAKVSMLAVSCQETGFSIYPL